MTHETDTGAKLVMMANQIATFFKSQPGEGQAEQVAAHLNDFWEPRMRSRFFALIDAGEPGFDPLVVRAAEHVKRPASA